MAKSQQELFELLKKGRGEAASAGAAPRRSPERSGKTARQRAPGTLGLGRRRVPVSLNLLLFFVAAFVLTNILSYMVGKWKGAAAEVPLTTDIERYWAVQVTPLLDENTYRERAWGLRDLLIDAGYEGAEVLLHHLRGRTYVRTIAARFLHENKTKAKAVVEKLTRDLPRLAKADRLASAVPIEVKVITITYMKNEPTGGRRARPAAGTARAPGD